LAGNGKEGSMAQLLIRDLDPETVNRLKELPVQRLV